MRKSSITYLLLFLLIITGKSVVFSQNHFTDEYGRFTISVPSPWQRKPNNVGMAGYWIYYEYGQPVAEIFINAKTAKSECIGSEFCGTVL